jgi:hypothetical protein
VGHHRHRRRCKGCACALAALVHTHTDCHAALPVAVSGLGPTTGARAQAFRTTDQLRHHHAPPTAVHVRVGRATPGSLASQHRQTVCLCCDNDTTPWPKRPAGPRQHTIRTRASHGCVRCSHACVCCWAASLAVGRGGERVQHYLNTWGGGGSAAAGAPPPPPPPRPPPPPPPPPAPPLLLRAPHQHNH